MRLVIQESYSQLSKWAACYIVKRINEMNPTPEKPFILGLPTGSTPLGTYKELIKLYNDKKVSFKNVVTFNMDEYVGLPEDHPESYHSFMWNNFFKHIDIKRENVNILNGNAPDPKEECERYEEKIKSYGGIDLFMGGIGPDGHIAFNDPHVADFDDPLKIKKVDLDETCRLQQVHDGCFDDISQVPEYALTLTIPTMFKASRLFCIVPASTKANAVKAAVFGPVSQQCPASILRTHQNAVLYTDKDSAEYIMDAAV